MSLSCTSSVSPYNEPVRWAIEVPRYFDEAGGTPAQPLSPAFGGFVDRWAAYPGAARVRDRYRRHRPPSAEIA